MTALYPELPDCTLIQLLAEKSSFRRDLNFDFMGTLNALRERVAAEVRYINLLFPEYTPHDEQYHLKRLFHVADTLLGAGNLMTMNSAELYVLACSLYAHDWGMAVSEGEKTAILDGKPTDPRDVSLLPDERTRFLNFAAAKLGDFKKDNLSKAYDSIWPDYVRHTHALRSGVRVQAYFSHVDKGVSEAVARACIGHALELEDLTDYRSYPVDFSVLRETVNLRAITIYLRLIDLFDLAEDRTPYVIWKFVQPRSARSKMEWEKHRALQAITCPPYQDGRIIRVDGSTVDIDVYAALEDLHTYCINQFAGCRDILARMNDDRHKLDIYDVDWRVAAVGFKPITIRFVFDRDRMFDVLSDEIYKGDAYVFLRELLQNSIDAIRTRRELLRRLGLAVSSMGVIQVNVDKKENGDSTITWEDDGVGMDEHIVRNYLAVAGKSYYRSEEFERQGLPFEPLSRFGVGILSCFMVSDCLIIETYKDPYFPPPGEALRIEIPSARSHFRVERRPLEAARIGTKITLSVRSAARLGLSKEDDRPSVTGYLKRVAGFVEFPIVVTEADERTIIIHPNMERERMVSQVGQGFKVAHVECDLPWAEIFLPQDLATAKGSLVEKRFDISKDLGLKGFEGIISYAMPKDSELEITNKSGRWPTNEVVLTKWNCPEWQERLRWQHGWSTWRDYGVDFSSIPSAQRHKSFAVYRDGILVPRVEAPDEWKIRTEAHDEFIGYHREGCDDHLPIPLMVVNLPSSTAPRIDLARGELVGEGKHWGQRVLEAWWGKLVELERLKTEQLSPLLRLYAFARSSVFDRLPASELWKVIPASDWPVPVLLPGGQVSVETLSNFGTVPIPICPKEISEEAALALCRQIGSFKNQPKLRFWEGERCMIRGSLEYFDEMPVSLKQMFWLATKRVSDLYYLDSVRFLEPPSSGSKPLFQEVWLPRPGVRRSLDEVLRCAAVELNSLTIFESQQIWRTEWLRPLLASFQEPYKEHFGYGLDVINLNHPVTKVLIEAAVTLELLSKRKKEQKAVWGALGDTLKVVTPRPVEYEPEQKSWSEYVEAFAKLRRLAHSVGLKYAANLDNWQVEPTDFVPNTLPLKNDRIVRKARRTYTQRFGKPLVFN